MEKRVYSFQGGIRKYVAWFGEGMVCLTVFSFSVASAILEVNLLKLR